MSDIQVDKLKVNLSNPQRSYQFEVVIPNPLGSGDSETLLVRARSATVPGRSFGKINIPWKNSAGYNVPGKIKFAQSWNVVFVEGEDAAIKEAIESWMNLIADGETLIGLGDNLIKKNIFLRLLATDGITVTSTYKLLGAFPAEVQDAPVDMASENEVTYTVVWSYDRWEME